MNNFIILILSLSVTLHAAAAGKTMIKSTSGSKPKIVAKEKTKQQKIIKIDLRKKKSGDLNTDATEMNKNIDQAEADLNGYSNNFNNNKIETATSNEKLTNSGAHLGTAESFSKTTISEPKSNFGLDLGLSRGQEVVLPKSGQYSSDINYGIAPSYKINESYTAGMKLSGVHNSDDSSKSELQAGSVKLNKAGVDINEYFTWSPTIVYGFPVNATQRDNDSYMGEIQGKINFSNKEFAFGDFSLSTTLGATRYFYQYSSKLKLKEKTSKGEFGNEVKSYDFDYNFDYDIFEGFQVKHPLLTKELSFAFTLVNRQFWDYTSARTHLFNMSETLTWQATEAFGIYIGLENEEAASVSAGEELKYRFYNEDTARYVVGISVSI